VLAHAEGSSLEVLILHGSPFACYSSPFRCKPKEHFLLLLLAPELLLLLLLTQEHELLALLGELAHRLQGAAKASPGATSEGVLHHALAHTGPHVPTQVLLILWGETLGHPSIGH
jgi:hypothetical protein